jgi:hypothetical protein
MLINVRKAQVCAQSKHGAIRWRAFVASVAPAALPAAKAARRLVALGGAHLTVRLDPDEQLRAQDAAAVVALLHRMYGGSAICVGVGRTVLIDTVTAVVSLAHESFATGFVSAGLVSAIGENCSIGELEALLLALATRLKQQQPRCRVTHARVIADMLTADFSHTAVVWTYQGGEAFRRAMIVLGEYVVLGCDEPGASDATQALVPVAPALFKGASYATLSRMWTLDLVLDDFRPRLLYAMVDTNLSAFDNCTSALLSRSPKDTHFIECVDTSVVNVVSIATARQPHVKRLEAILRRAVRSAALPYAAAGGLQDFAVNRVAVDALRIASVSTVAVPPSLLTTIHKARPPAAEIVRALTVWSHADTYQAARLLLVRRPFVEIADVDTCARLTALDATSYSATSCSAPGCSATVPLCLGAFAAPDVTEREARRLWSDAWERAFAALPLERRASRIWTSSGVAFAAVCWNADCPRLDGDADCCGENENTGLCSRCLKACYCSDACQRAGWRSGHRRVCSVDL